MILLFLPHVNILFALSLLAGLVGIVAWKRRAAPGGFYLAAAMFAVTQWAFAAAVEAGVIGQSSKILWSKIEYIGFVNVFPLLFCFILVYTSRNHWVTPLTRTIIWLVPVSTLLFAWTNEQHGLVWSGFFASNLGKNILIYQHGPWFWVFTAYTYLLFGVSVVILASDSIRAHRAYRWQIGAILLAAFLPAVSGWVYLSTWNPVPGLDWTPIGTAGAGMILLLGIVRLRLLDLIPIARDTLFEILFDGVIVVDQQKRIVDINPAAVRLLHASQRDWVGQSTRDLMPPHLQACPLEMGLSVSKCVVGFSQPEDQFVEMNSSPLYDPRGVHSGWLVILRDVTERKQFEARLQAANERYQLQIAEIQDLQDRLCDQANHDALTGLYNRRCMEEVMARELELAQMGSYPLTVAMIDLDHYKQFNDRYGHRSGDLLLQALSDMLRRKTRAGDITFRYGGDEIMLVLPNLGVENALRRAEEWRAEFENTAIAIYGRQASATLSIGLAVFPDHCLTGEDLIRRADQALYAAKASGRNSVRCVQRATLPLNSVPAGINGA